MTNQDGRANLILRILCVLAVATGGGGRASPAQSSPPKTVADYFLLVPEKYFPYDLSFRQELLRGQYRGGVIDIRNGYISSHTTTLATISTRSPHEFYALLFCAPNFPGEAAR